ncbi:RNA-binding protein lark-like isoform X2 [Gigantopelta aegis]|uniref:RNA-binding protein lark-like isoform X2 n=1 Tax=Gigantopelta aegis TaxID=1735272 RepID=UPI001B887B1F|nr:RNA-binding protein lark-like isoform X2 [Gigantopelta aegis]
MSRKVSTKVFIGNMPDTCRKTDLEEMFSKYGEIVECDIVKNFGFVHFADPTCAKTAVDNLNGIQFQGTDLKVELSHSRVRQKPGMGGQGDCYKCGKSGHWSKDCPSGPTRPRYPPRESPYARPRDPYDDPYYRDRYLPPPPPMDRYRPYPDIYDRRPPPPPRDPYYRDRDPYTRPPPDYYRRSPPRDPYYDDYYRRRPLPPVPGRAASPPLPVPPRSRVPGPY